VRTVFRASVRTVFRASVRTIFRASVRTVFRAAKTAENKILLKFLFRTEKKYFNVQKIRIFREAASFSAKLFSKQRIQISCRQKNVSMPS
jgi:hypothetical protein